MDDPLHEENEALRRDLRDVRVCLSKAEGKLTLRAQVWPMVVFALLVLVYANWQNTQEERARVRGLQGILKEARGELWKVRDEVLKLAAPGPVRMDLEEHFDELRDTMDPQVWAERAE